MNWRLLKLINISPHNQLIISISPHGSQASRKSPLLILSILGGDNVHSIILELEAVAMIMPCSWQLFIATTYCAWRIGFNSCFLHNTSISEQNFLGSVPQESVLQNFVLLLYIHKDINFYCHIITYIAIYYFSKFSQLAMYCVNENSHNSIYVILKVKNYFESALATLFMFIVLNNYFNEQC